MNLFPPGRILLDESFWLKEKEELSTKANIRWGLLGAYCLLIFLASSIPGATVPLPGRFDKVYHLIEYGALGFLVFVATRDTLRLGSSWAVILSFIFSLLYGLSDEWHQSFVPGRSASAGDVVADGIGSLLGALLALYINRRAKWPSR